MLSFQARDIGLRRDKLEETNFRLFHVNILWTNKDSGDLGRVSDFLSNFLFIKIQGEKTSADFPAGVSLGHF